MQAEKSNREHSIPSIPWLHNAKKKRKKDNIVQVKHMLPCILHTHFNL